MSRFWRKFTTFLSVFYAEMLEYRAELYLWALSGIMPFILMGLWGRAGRQVDLGMSSVDFVRYFLCVFIVRQLTVVWVVWEFEQDVIQGRLSPYLLQPVNPVWRYLASHTGERFARTPFILALVGIFFALYPDAFWLPPPGALLLAGVAIVMAFAMRFVMQYAFAMLAFWTERANAIEDLWFTVYLFLSGFIAPLDVFPPAVRAFSLWTPFPYMIYLPAKLLMGQGTEQMAQGLVVMAAWGVFFLLLQTTLWRLGLRRYSAMGA